MYTVVVVKKEKLRDAVVPQKFAKINNFAFAVYHDLNPGHP